MKNWCCKPTSEAEAVEIVRRAIANGAVVKEVPAGFDFAGAEFSWNYCEFWGAYDGKTITHDGFDVMGEQLTIQQVREQFPLPYEVKVMSDKKEWQDGLPPIGFHGEITWGKKEKWFECVVIPGNAIAIFSNGTWVVTDVFHDVAFRPLRTDREKWVEQAVIHATKEGYINEELAFFIARKIYDNMIKEAQ